jgi:hypothetical protein
VFRRAKEIFLDRERLRCYRCADQDDQGGGGKNPWNIRPTRTKAVSAQLKKRKGFLPLPVRQANSAGYFSRPKAWQRFMPNRVISPWLWRFTEECRKRIQLIRKSKRESLSWKLDDFPQEQQKQKKASIKTKRKLMV